MAGLREVDVFMGDVWVTIVVLGYFDTGMDLPREVEDVRNIKRAAVAKMYGSGDTPHAQFSHNCNSVPGGFPGSFPSAQVRTSLLHDGLHPQKATTSQRSFVACRIVARCFRLLQRLDAICRSDACLANRSTSRASISLESRGH